MGAALGFNVDTSYKSPFAFPSKHELISEFNERCVALLRFVTRDEFLVDGPVLLITHGINVGVIPFTVCSLKPPHFGYCAMAAIECKPFSALAQVGTAQLEANLPQEIVGGTSGTLPCPPLLWLACATGVETDPYSRIFRWADRSAAAVTAAATASAMAAIRRTAAGSTTLGTPLGTPVSSPGASPAVPHHALAAAAAASANAAADSRANARMAYYCAHPQFDCHAVQPRESVRPRLVHAVSLRRVPVASFDGNGQHLVAPLSGTFRSFTVATLVRPVSLSDLHVLLTADPYKDTHGLEIRIDKLGNVGVFAGDIAAVVARSCVDVERWVLIVLRVRNGKEARLWIDYTRVVVGGSLRGLCPAFGSWQGLYLGGGSPIMRSFHGDIAELVAFPEGLTDAQIDKLHNYFIAKFA